MYVGLNNTEGCTFATLSAVNPAWGGTKSTQIWLTKSCIKVYIQYTSLIEKSTTFKLLFEDGLNAIKFGKELAK